MIKYLFILVSILTTVTSCRYVAVRERKIETKPLTEYAGYELVWQDEFNVEGKPDSSIWIYENGFVRNEELQWYQEYNANCKDGVLLIKGLKEDIANPNYSKGSTEWRTAREKIKYTSSSIKTRGQKEWLYGIFEIRARIDTAVGSWPAIWLLGTARRWPACGEIDIMEHYLVDGRKTILANAAWLGEKSVEWNSAKIDLSQFTANDPHWTNRFHVWKMDWDSESISIYLDDKLLNKIDISKTINPDGTNPFHEPQHILLNLALGGNGGDPVNSKFPITYEIDYVRVYQKK